MKQEKIISIIALSITAIFTVAGAIFLPDIVRIQRNMINGISTDVPKLWGILLAAALGVAGVVGFLTSKKPENQKGGMLVVSVCGYVLFIYMFIASWAI